MKIPLDVSRRCVQSAAKSAHESLLKAALKTGCAPDSEMEEGIEALRAFLENADFPALRSAHPALSGGAGAEVLLETGGKDRFSLVLEGEPVFSFKEDR